MLSNEFGGPSVQFRCTKIAVIILLAQQTKMYDAVILYAIISRCACFSFILELVQERLLTALAYHCYHRSRICNAAAGDAGPVASIVHCPDKTQSVTSTVIA